MPPKAKYTDPELREQVKEELKQGDKGGAPGQWSARKAQMMASEYKKRGGDYNTDKSEQDASQKNLSKWGEEEWQTKEGSGNAKQEDGTEKRYLPKKAWEKMTETEKEETDQKKLKESKEGKQFVQNTNKAKEKRKEANEEETEKFEKGKTQEKKQNNKRKGDHQAEHNDDNKGANDKEQDAEASQKRKKTNHLNATNKKAKSGTSDGQSGIESKQANENPKTTGDTEGSKHASVDEPAPRGSVDRLPKKGQKAYWKVISNIVEGKVQEVLTKDKKLNGKNVKASEDEPKLVLKSNAKSGKICVHKPGVCFYEDS